MDSISTASTVSASFDFRNGTEGWEAGFADYPTGQWVVFDAEGRPIMTAEQFYDLEAGLRPLPPELGIAGTGFLLSGENYSDDLFMFLKRRLGPEHVVVPKQNYQVIFDLVFASNAPSGAVGPGTPDVPLKAGAGPVEPIPVLADPPYVRMNVDIGDHRIGGPAASVVGGIANGTPIEEVLGELSKILSGDVVLPTVRADGWAGPTLRVRRVAVPEDHPRVLLDRPGPQLPERLGSLEETEAVLTAQMKM